MKQKLGFKTDFNLPGDSMGEYNGMYAAVTENLYESNGMNGMEYTTANPGDRTSILSGFRDLLYGARDIIGNVSQVRSDIRREQARAEWEAQRGYQPSITEQWNTLNGFEKFGFFAAVLGVVVFLVKK